MSCSAERAGGLSRTVVIEWGNWGLHVSDKGGDETSSVQRTIGSTWNAMTRGWFVSTKQQPYNIPYYHIANTRPRNESSANPHSTDSAALAIQLGSGRIISQISPGDCPRCKPSAGGGFLFTGRKGIQRGYR
jgi:hypothetical protein